MDAYEPRVEGSMRKPRKPAKDKTVRLTRWELSELRSHATASYLVFAGHSHNDGLTEDEIRKMQLWKELSEKLSG